MITRTPIKRKRAKPRRGRLRDPKYMAWISTLHCIVCGRCQMHPTEVAHVGVRGIGQKCSDRETLPICERHHQTGRYALHKLGKHFWALHGLDKMELIAKYQEAYEAVRGSHQKH